MVQCPVELVGTGGVRCTVAVADSLLKGSPPPVFTVTRESAGVYTFTSRPQ